MRPSGPLVQLTLALVVMTVTLVMLADLFLDVFPSRADNLRRARQQVAESLATQLAATVRGSDLGPLQSTVKALSHRLTDVQSLAVRRTDGALLADSGAHTTVWREPQGKALHQFSVPLSNGDAPWGTVEVAFTPDDRPAWRRALDDPLARLIGFVVVLGSLAYALYMRRALQHLDPASVIPDRVQRAFDAMTEGVAVLDARGRVLLVNKSFRRLHPQADQVRTGHPLSSVNWLQPALPTDLGAHPWARAMAGKVATNGDTLELRRQDQETRQLVVNCAPITDAGGAVRGCLATFDDVTDLHHANAALKKAMDEVSAAKEEVLRQNVELERLATRDPMTGCLNRRALFEALSPMFDQAQASGSPLACLMLDIDYFKLVNDTHGHSVGDRVIQEVARHLLASVRPEDLVCRYGGEEFCVIVPGLAVPQVLELAEGIRRRVEVECGPGVHEVPEMRVTISVGCDTDGQRAPSAQAMIDHADHALYAAKRGGRNRVARFTR